MARPRDPRKTYGLCIGGTYDGMDIGVFFRSNVSLRDDTTTMSMPSLDPWAYWEDQWGVRWQVHETYVRERHDGQTFWRYKS